MTLFTFQDIDIGPTIKRFKYFSFSFQHSWEMKGNTTQKTQTVKTHSLAAAEPEPELMEIVVTLEDQLVSVEFKRGRAASLSVGMQCVRLQHYHHCHHHHHH